MFSAGMLAALASVTTVRRRGFMLMSPLPFLAATVISLMRRVNSLPRLASSAPFLCLMVCHLEWPDMAVLQRGNRQRPLSLANLPRHDDPHVGAAMPGPAIVIAHQHLHLQAGLAEPPCHLGHRQGAEGQGKGRGAHRA